MKGRKMAKNKVLEEFLPVLKKTKENLLKGIDLAEKECPELIKEIVRWKIVDNLYQAGLSLLVVCGTTPIFIFGGKQVEDDFGWALVIALTSALDIILCVTIACCINNILKVLIARRLFLVEYITNLFKKGD